MSNCLIDFFKLTGILHVLTAYSLPMLGRAGSTIKKIAEESGAKISMTSKDESIFTQERILSISGSKACCVKCLSMVIGKLAEDGDLAQFQNRGTTYVTNQGTGFDSRNSAAGRGRPVRPAVGTQKTARNGSINGCKNILFHCIL